MTARIKIAILVGVMILGIGCTAVSVDAPNVQDQDYGETYTMPFLGKRSLQNLSEAQWHLQKVVQRAISKKDFSIIDAHRTKPEQELAFVQRTSRARYGESPHNTYPACAVDVIPSPFVSWGDEESFRKVAEAFRIAVVELKKEQELPYNFELEFGLDWGWDMPHIEIKGWKKG